MVGKLYFPAIFHSFQSVSLYLNVTVNAGKLEEGHDETVNVTVNV
jgi:hypothetical protein